MGSPAYRQVGAAGPPRPQGTLAGGQRFFDGGVEFDGVVFAQIALDDVPLLVDQESGRRQLEMTDVAGQDPRTVKRYGIWQIWLFSQIHQLDERETTKKT